MRKTSCLAALLGVLSSVGLASCEAIYGGLSVPAADNCVVSGLSCDPGKVCNQRTQICEDMLVVSQISPAHANTSEQPQLTITGENFVPGTIVKWNGTPLPATIDSPTQLRVQAPASADGSWRVTVEVTLPSGLTVSRSDLFSYSSATVLLQPAVVNSVPPLLVLQTGRVLSPTRDDLLYLDGSNRLHLFTLASDGVSVTERPPALIAPQNTLALTVADFNSDGFLDIGVTSGSALHWLLAKMDHTFAPVQTLQTGLSLERVLEHGDIDQDGSVDLIGIEATDKQVTLLSHSGATLTRLPAAGFSGLIQSIAVGELDGQPGDDIAISFMGAADHLSIIHGGATPALAQDVSFSSKCTNGIVQVGRFRGGATYDLLVRCNERIQVLLGKGDGTFTEGAFFPIMTTTQTAVDRPAIADFNGDGDLDAVVLRTDSTSGSMQPQLWLLDNSDGRGSLSARDLQLTVSVLVSPKVLVGDFNDDGKPDIVIGETSSSGMTRLSSVLNVSR